MNKITTTVIAATIATSTLLSGLSATVFAEEGTTSTTEDSKFTVSGELPPIDVETNLPILMTALTVEAEPVTEYTVLEGDNLFRIANEFLLDVETLKTWNNLTNDLLQIGQVLSVVGQVEPTEEQLAALEAAKKDSEQANQKNKPRNAQQSASSDTNASGVLDIAYQYLGVPYVFGGTTPSGFDCSGYISYVFKKAGKLDSHHTAASLYNIAQKVSTPQVGDLVFFSGTYKSGISHVGIYIGDNKMISASGKKVQISNIYDSYWGKHFTGFGQI